MKSEKIGTQCVPARVSYTDTHVRGVIPDELWPPTCARRVNTPIQTHTLEEQSRKMNKETAAKEKAEVSITGRSWQVERREVCERAQLSPQAPTRQASS